jgi:hypothetical protein
MNWFKKGVVFTFVVVFLFFPTKSRAWLPDMEAEEESYWGLIYGPMEEGYWGSTYEKEFKLERRVPFALTLDIKNEYDDNIFSTEKNQSRDLITYINPGLQINSRGLRYAIALDYQMAVTKYADLDSAPGINLRELDYIGHNLRLMAKRMINDRLKVGVEELFLLSRRPTDVSFATNQISAAKYFRNWVSPYLEHQLSDRTSLRLKFRFDTLHYLETLTPSDENSSAYSVDVTLGHELNSRTNVYVDARALTRDYEISTNYNAYQAVVGITRKFNPRYRGEISFGAQQKYFDKQIKGQVGDTTRMIGMAKLVRETKKTLAELSFSHYPADLGMENSYYSVDRASLNFFYSPYSKTSLAASIFFEGLGYDEEKGLTESGHWEKRDDKLYGGDFLIQYTLKRWLILSLGYTRIERDSNLINSDYKENRVFFSIKGVAELWKN